MTILFKPTYRFNAIPIRIPMAFFCRKKKNAKIHTQFQKKRERENHSNFEKKKNKAGGLTFPGFKIY